MTHPRNEDACVAMAVAAEAGAGARGFTNMLNQIRAKNFFRISSANLSLFNKLKTLFANSSFVLSLLSLVLVQPVLHKGEDFILGDLSARLHINLGAQARPDSRSFRLLGALRRGRLVSSRHDFAHRLGSRKWRIAFSHSRKTRRGDVVSETSSGRDDTGLQPMFTVFCSIFVFLSFSLLLGESFQCFFSGRVYNGARGKEKDAGASVNGTINKTSNLRGTWGLTCEIDRQRQRWRSAAVSFQFSLLMLLQKPSSRVECRWGRRNNDNYDVIHLPQALPLTHEDNKQKIEKLKIEVCIHKYVGTPPCCKLFRLFSRFADVCGSVHTAGVLCV